MPDDICPACEEGTCETHDNSRSAGSGAPVHPANAGDTATRKELEALRHKTARSVKRLNNAIKKQRANRVQTEPEPIRDAPIESKPKRSNPVFAWGLSLVPRKKS